MDKTQQAILQTNIRACESYFKTIQSKIISRKASIVELSDAKVLGILIPSLKGHCPMREAHDIHEDWIAADSLGG